MIVYQFDGTFEGLITCFYHAMKNKENPAFISGNSIQENFFRIDLEIMTDLSIYHKMERYLIDRCTFECFETVYKAFLKDDECLYSQLFYFISQAKKYREQTLFMRTDEELCKVIKAKLCVEREAHRLTGFLRFKKLSEQLLYAEYTPTNNVTSLISGHFKDRFNQYNFIIHDTKRKIYAIYDQKNCLIGKYTEDKKIGNIQAEDEYEHFFKTYHNHIAIPKRKNLKLQMNFMPKKYWNFITEMIINE
ncbi:MAG: TIGR03915 family putative DNA repair protein [Clostridia bacterium]|nr:TIGR03915 family putative DNA repair protein [Clostridia bacterium]